MNELTVSNHFGVAFCVFVVLACSCPAWLGLLLRLGGRRRALRPMKRDFYI